MQLQPFEIYHIYNRGNNKEAIFFAERNYAYFLQKMEKYISPVCDILAYCLMPDHFHFLIYTTEKSTEIKEQATGLPMNHFSYGLKQLLSSYSKAINKQENRKGSLFTQNTHGTKVSDDSMMEYYVLWYFYYIHQNPVRAGLVSKASHWQYSSYRAYIGLEESTICNKIRADELFILKSNTWLWEDDIQIPRKIAEKLLI